MIRLLLWDVDGTLLDFHAAQSLAIAALFTEYGLGECTGEMLSVYDGINRKYWEKLERKEITKEECLLGRFREFFSLYGIPGDCIPAFNSAYQIRLGDYPVFMPHAMETVTELKARGIPQFAVTNGTKTAQDRKLKATGLDRIFDEIFISDVIGAEKPSPLFFEPVLKKAGERIPGIKKEEIMIVGDSLTSDMLGGRNAGIRTCWYRSEEAAEKEHVPPDKEIRDLREILEEVI